MHGCLTNGSFERSIHDDVWQYNYLLTYRLHYRVFDVITLEYNCGCDIAPSSPDAHWHQYFHRKIVISASSIARKTKYWEKSHAQARVEPLISLEAKNSPEEAVPTTLWFMYWPPVAVDNSPPGPEVQGLPAVVGYYRHHADWQHNNNINDGKWQGSVVMTSICRGGKLVRWIRIILPLLNFNGTKYSGCE